MQKKYTLILKFSETDIIKMLQVLIYNTCAMFGGHVYQQAVYSPMHINCAPLLTDFFLYSSKADFLQGLLKKN